MKFILIRLSNIGLRGTTLVSKFFLIFLLARYLEPSELGLYGLLTVTISYVLFLLGLDFYVYANREVLKADVAVRGRLLKSEAALWGGLYTAILPLTLFLFVFELLPWKLLPWFLCLLVLEHITQELNRLLVILSRQLVASWILFFRAGAWCLVVIALMGAEPEYRTLETVMTAWVLGAFVALGIGFVVIVRSGIGGWKLPIDWAWVRKGIRIALPMLVATLALRAFYTVDRYWFEELVGLDVLGAYVLFIGMCNALLSFMDAGVFTFFNPALISANANQDAKVFREKFRQMLIQTVGLVIGFSLVAWYVVDPLLRWLDRPLYLEYQYLFGWLLLGNALFVMSMVPHYGLYARGHDKPLVISHLVGLVVFVATTALITPHTSDLAVPFGLISGFGFILFWKTLQFYRLTPPNWR
ncbi:hypothetical protein KUV44_08305 [Marinobacter daepoensis]|uniref:Membrane protein involved in the export of O-antigen and teichoic acid n=1 Tax=Marinobacter daepoensis TaxID=262077 RepID=A0ABS3BHH1_9GAMM|nr:hypothetical protein [Marinobacter daepoensis]MBN7771274.1 hypothetical protein [Marinobacter daepoensis]MBY6079136.1 hypothetical protein [Marinobacter daepoensis]